MTWSFSFADIIFYFSQSLHSICHFLRRQKKGPFVSRLLSRPTLWLDHILWLSSHAQCITSTYTVFGRVTLNKYWLRRPTPKDVLSLKYLKLSPLKNYNQQKIYMQFSLSARLIMQSICTWILKFLVWKI